jgi:hypothetical protein
MTRKQPPVKDRPIKTEPGATRLRRFMTAELGVIKLRPKIRIRKQKKRKESDENV